MYPPHESLLGNGYWEETKSDLNFSIRVRMKKWAADLLRPSWWTRAVGPRKQLRRTAYLDGLRGFAALVVYWQHHQAWARMSIEGDVILEMGFGYKKQYYFACLPVIRTFFTGGHFAVTLFFIMSGYVLSSKPLLLIQMGDYSRLGDNLASALFRRWLRLWIPVLCTTFLFMTSWHTFGLWTDTVHQSNYRDELWKWYVESKNFSFIFRTGGEPWFYYNFHVWSIPVEMRGSITVYTVLLALSRCAKNARLWCQVGVIFYFVYIVDGIYFSMFAMGMLLCDFDLLAENDNLPRFFSRLEPWKNSILYSLLVISIYLSSVPPNGIDLLVLRASPGWYYLSFLKPQAVFDPKWFYLLWAGTSFMIVLPRISWLKGFFETRFSQYLGRISYAFYLVHGPILWTLGDRLYVATGWSREIHAISLPNWINIFPLSKAGPFGLELSFLVPHLILLPVTLWLAEIVTKLVDEPSVKFSQWAYELVVEPSIKP